MLAKKKAFIPVPFIPILTLHAVEESQFKDVQSHSSMACQLLIYISHFWHWTSAKCLMHHGASEYGVTVVQALILTSHDATQKMAMRYPTRLLSHGSVMRYSKLAKREMEDSTKSLAFLQVACKVGATPGVRKSTMLQKDGHGWSDHPIGSPTLGNEMQ